MTRRRSNVGRAALRALPVRTARSAIDAVVSAQLLLGQAQAQIHVLPAGPGHPLALVAREAEPDLKERLAQAIDDLVGRAIDAVRR